MNFSSGFKVKMGRFIESDSSTTPNDARYDV